MPSHNKLTSLPALALLSASLPLTAQTDDSRLETMIVSATRAEQQLDAATHSVGVVDEAALKLMSHVHISEALARVPGTWVSRGNGQEHLTAIRSPVLTGPGSCGAFYMAEDGIPLRAPGFCNVNQLFDVNAEQAARIEVIRGPGSAVHGANALNGLVNVISLAPVAEPSLQLALEGGPHDYSRVKASVSNGNDTHRFRLSANGAHDGGYKDDSGFDQQKFSARYDYSGEVWSIQSLLSASNLNQETAGFVNGEDAYKDDDRKKENPNPEAYRDTQSARFYTRFERAGSDDTRLVITPYARYTEMEFLQHFLPGTPLEENGHHSFGMQAAFYKPLSDSANLHHGIDLDLSSGYLKETQAAASFGPFPTGKHYDYEVDSLNLAWFVGGDKTFGDGTRVNAGARYEAQRYSYDNKMLDGSTADDGSNPCPGTCRYSRPGDDTDEFRNWSLFTGLIHPLDDHLSVVAQLAHGFRAPQATELYRLQAGQLKADLDAEELNSVELGLRGRWQRVQYDLTAYAMKKNNVIIQDSDRRNLSDGQTLRRGIEASLNWQIVDTLALAVQASYAKEQYDNDALPDRLSPSLISIKGNEVDTAPRQLASAQLRWTPLASTTIELEWQHLGEHFLDAVNEHRYSGHDLLHLRWRQQYGAGIYSNVRVHNLSDEDYADRADFAFGNFRYFIGEPRAVFVELGLEL